MIQAFAAATGRGVVGNVPASGTEIIERLGEEHHRTGKWIVYTSADSAPDRPHQQTVPLEELYGACKSRAGDSRASTRSAGDRAAVRRRARCLSGAPGVGTTSRSSPRADHLEDLVNWLCR